MWTIGLSAQDDGFFKERVMDWLYKRGFDAGMLIGVQTDQILSDRILIIADTDI
jgi:hypothetical protein